MALEMVRNIPCRYYEYIDNTFRSIMNDRAEGPFIIACNGHSPYIRHMKRFGFNPVWETNLFVSE